uniref:Cytochrome c oxidase subunit 7C, mitochondrial n=1 Tax=Graphocephala atropunctata TaxID=36148 RepID=Q1W2C6_9HEMI|nr:putative mitochondrial cytochrome c oxidase polypeptide VIIc [Graphocephala atropunctata]
MLPRFSPVIRNLSTSLARRSQPGGIPGVNLPFSLDNKFKLTALFVVYFGSGMSVPFLMLRHSLTK